MLLEIAQKPTIRAYSARNFLINTSVVFETMYQDKFVLIKKFAYFMPNSKDMLSRRSEIAEIQKSLTLLRSCRTATCLKIL
jgi:hypothetical protein